MIRSFGDSETANLFARGEAKRMDWKLQRVALRKMAHLNNARDLQTLGQLPGNRLKSLKGRLSDYHSIRINDQWRVIFRWKNGDAYNVQIVDYH